MSRIVLALLLVTAWLDAHAQSSLPPCPRFVSVTTWENCFGTYTFEEGEFKGHKYVGDFLRDGVFHGQGTYTYANGDKYVGEYRVGKRTGQGTFTSATGEKYVGEFWDGKSHGQGTYTWPDGEKYVGEFRDGKSHGQGTHTWPDGSKYVGEWRDDKYHGQGTYTFANGDKFVGEYQDGKAHGQGTLTFTDGRRYVGEYRGNKFYGQGTYTFADGSKYVGEWRDDKYHGQGILYNVNGTVQESGMWRDGELLQSFAIDTAQSPPGASSGVEAKDSPTRKPRKRTSVEIVNDCLAKGLKPGTSQFSKCVAGQ
jgi:hypothetical protein